MDRAAPRTSRLKSKLRPVFTEDEICQELGVSPQQLETLADCCCVLRVTRDDGQTVYPSFQLVNGAMLPDLDAVLGQLADGVEDTETWWRWLCDSQAATNDRARWELLRDGEGAAVIRAASRSAWAWRP